MKEGISLNELREQVCAEKEYMKFLILGSELPVFWGFCEALKAAAES